MRATSSTQARLRGAWPRSASINPSVVAVESVELPRAGPGTRGGRRRRRGCDPSSETRPGQPPAPAPRDAAIDLRTRLRHTCARQTSKPAAGDAHLEVIGNLVGRDAAVAIAIPRRHPVDRAHQPRGRRAAGRGPGRRCRRSRGPDRMRQPTRRPRAASILAIGERRAAPSDKSCLSPSRSITSASPASGDCGRIDRGELLAFEVAVLVRVGGLEPLRENAPDLARGVRPSSTRTSTRTCPISDLDVAVSNLANLDPLRPESRPSAGTNRRRGRSLRREGDIERQVDRQPPEELSQLVECRASRPGSCRPRRTHPDRSRTPRVRACCPGFPECRLLRLVVLLEQEPRRPKRRLTRRAARRPAEMRSSALLAAGRDDLTPCRPIAGL